MGRDLGGGAHPRSLGAGNLDPLGRCARPLVRQRLHRHPRVRMAARCPASQRHARHRRVLARPRRCRRPRSLSLGSARHRRPAPRRAHRARRSRGRQLCRQPLRLAEPAGGHRRAGARVARHRHVHVGPPRQPAGAGEARGRPGVHRFVEPVPDRCRRTGARPRPAPHRCRPPDPHAGVDRTEVARQPYGR